MVEITTSIEDNIYEILVNGEIDASSSIHLDGALEKAFHDHTRILVNLSDLKYISSAGLGVFIARLDEIKTNDRKMVLFGLNENVRQVFGILGLEQLLIIKETKEDSVEVLNEA
ncbi:MAG: STAS domain-containing protein [Cyclobacteriaceae bacterium]